jgi:hypothetical protein
MPALRELQAAIGSAMLGGDAGAAVREIEPDGLAPEARLEIYRHHVLTTLTSALEATFPVICRLVDRRFFAYAADSYLRAHPPTGPCLFEYGDSFPDFLAAFPPCRDLAYLPDVARLEWAISAALHAPNVDAMDPACLADVAAEDLPRLTFAVDPSVSYLESPWPVDRIWRANQDEDGASSDPVDLASGGVWLEVRRAGDVATMRALAAADYALRTTFARGGTLEDAAAAALGVDPHFDLTAALHALLAERIFTGFAVSN